MSDLFMEMQQRRRAKTQTTADSMRINEDESPKACVASATLDDDDPLANILSLKLKKPKGWNWELSTSRSCTNIALPRIMLYDHKGQLLVDANSQQERVYKQTDFDVPTAKVSRKQKRTTRAASANLAESIIRPVLNREFSGLQIEEATPSPEPPLLNGRAEQMSRSRNESPASIEFQTTELPDYKFERRSNSFKEVRFKMDKRQKAVNEVEPYNHIIDLPTPPSTKSTTSSSGPSEKRRYRRSQSSSLGRSPATSESILERFSYTRGRFSSPEYIEEHNVQHSPRYFLRTSKAGTLVVKEESFSRYRRRHKPRNSSAENLRNESSSKSRSSSCFKLPSAQSINELQLPLGSPQSGSLQNVAAVAQTRTRKKSFPVRRYRSDGNILMQQQNSSSSDTEAEHRMNGDGSNNDGNRRSSRRYTDYRKRSKNGLVTIDPGNGILPAVEKPTAR